jgi:hypothetical protein
MPDSGLLHCFSYPSGVPPVSDNRDAAQPALCGWLNCFSYPGDVPGTRTRAAAQSAQSGYLSCFSCPADVPPGLRRMHTGSTCFRY